MLNILTIEINNVGEINNAVLSRSELEALYDAEKGFYDSMENFDGNLQRKLMDKVGEIM